MKRFMPVLLIMCLFAACNNMDFTTSNGLTIEKHVFAKTNESGNLNQVDNPVFNIGEEVNYVLINVSGFKKGDDGLNWFDLDMEVTNEADSLILDQKGLLGEGGHIDLPDNIAESPYGIFSTSSVLRPGKYRIKLTITDKIGSGKASSSSTFVLK